MEQTIKINVPEGKKAVYDENTQTIKFVNIEPNRSKSWEEFCKNHMLVKNEYCVHNHGIRNTAGVNRYIYKDYLETEKDAEGILALIQLTRLHDEWVGNWKIYNNGKYYSITHDRVNLEDFVIEYCNFRLLSFPTKEMAKEFLDCFGDLIEKARRFI